MEGKGRKNSNEASELKGLVDPKTERKTGSYTKASRRIHTVMKSGANLLTGQSYVAEDPSCQMTLTCVVLKKK